MIKLKMIKLKVYKYLGYFIINKKSVIYITDF
ncbi:hypothetical protein NTHI1209_02212 [Haemophilus influenzae]|uniref:Uncharacterized protein n=1 Tax=Haemophilus influenzae TaxID=727 RepID=A0A158T0B3_HAEIF|nr:hypothetical protein NTHI1209_02212 [Haemophilus influenzae]